MGEQAAGGRLDQLWPEQEWQERCRVDRLRRTVKKSGKTPLAEPVPCTLGKVRGETLGSRVCNADGEEWCLGADVYMGSAEGPP